MLGMHVCSGCGFKGKIEPRPDSRVWLIWADDYEAKPVYPSNERTLLIAGKHLPASYGLEILQRSELHHGIFVRLALGTDPKKRAAFIAALEKETNIK